MPSDPAPPSATLGMTQLAQTWARRLEQVTLGLPHDALVVLRGPSELVGQRFELDRQARTIRLQRGAADAPAPRGPGAPILLPSGYVSDPHAELEAVPRGWQVKDLGSSNHTYVGTVRIDVQRLVYGDELLLGDVALVFVSAERGAVPPHVLDRDSGLLAPRVFTAEAARFARVGDGEQDLGLLLLRVEGLRELLDAPERAGGAALVRRLGDALLARFGADVVIGRLEAELFAVAFKSTTPAVLRQHARQICEVVASLLGPRGLSARSVICARGGRAARFTGLLSCALAALDAPHAAEMIIEAELDVHGALLADAELLAVLSAQPVLPLLVLYIEDEDGLRHRVGHDRLGALRWQLRRLTARAAAEAWGGVEVQHLGVLDDRLFVLALAEGAGSGTLVDTLRQRFTNDLERALGPEAAWHRLGSVLIPAGAHASGRALRRELLEAVSRAAGEGLGAGQRQPVVGLPAPVAAPYGLIWVVTSHTARVKTILDAAEVALRFVTAAVLAAVTSRCTAADDLAALRKELQLRPGKGLAMGEWAALLRRLAPRIGALVEIDPLAQTLGRALGLGRRGPRLVHLLERQLLPFRNRFVHGETAPREARSAEQVQALLAELNEVLDCLAPLRELQLLTLLESTPRRAGGARASIRALSGARENFEVRQVDLRGRQELFPGSTYLTTSDYRHLLELAPLITLQLCPRCEREEIFLADGLAAVGQTLRLSAVTTGHRLNLALDAELVPEGLAALLG